MNGVMAPPRGPNPATMGLLVLNLLLYGAFAIIAGWAIDYGIEETGKTGKMDEFISLLSMSDE